MDNQCGDPFTVCFLRRCVLLESSLTYTDLARVRVAAVAYAERIASRAGRRLSGVGFDGVYVTTLGVSTR